MFFLPVSLSLHRTDCYLCMYPWLCVKWRRRRRKKRIPARLIFFFIPCFLHPFRIYRNALWRMFFFWCKEELKKSRERGKCKGKRGDLSFCSDLAGFQVTFRMFQNDHYNLFTVAMLVFFLHGACLLYLHRFYLLLKIAAK